MVDAPIPRDPPLYSVSTFSTPHNSIADDILQIRATGARGIGLWEGKFGESQAEAVRSMVVEHGLRVTSCSPRVWTILPVPWASPTIPAMNFSRVERDPRIRTQLICDSLEGLSVLAPDCILLGTGSAAAAPAGVDAREAVADGLGRIADVAARHGLRIGFELTSARRGAPIARLTDMVQLIETVGRRNVGVIVDIYHSAAEPGVHDELRTYVERIVGVHVNDVPSQERGLYDRALPGEGRGLAPGFIATLLAAGYRGWYELEIVSDDGTFGDALPDSLWAIPHEELLRRGMAAFDRAYRRALEGLRSGADAS